MEEAARTAGPVDRRRLVQLSGDALQAGEQQDREERHAPPQLGDDHRAEDGVRIAEHGRLGGAEVAHDAGGGVVEQDPDARGEHSGDRPRREDHRACEAPADETFIHHQRQGEAEEELENDLHDHPFGGEAQAGPEQRVLEQHLPEVVQAGEAVGPWFRQVVVLQAVVQDAADGVDEEHRDQQHRRRDQQVRGPAQGPWAPPRLGCPGQSHLDLRSIGDVTHS